jgi:hypothetical protein
MDVVFVAGWAAGFCFNLLLDLIESYVDLDLVSFMNKGSPFRVAGGFFRELNRNNCVGYVQKVLKPFFKKNEICVNSETLWTTVLEK